jgi:Coenzyme PQQ synthesis protein D (PqqD)
MIDFAQKITIPEQVLAQSLEEGFVLLNIQTDYYFGLDDVASQMWQALTENESIQVAYEKLLAIYKVDPDQLKQDLQSLIEQLLSHQLIQVEA